MNKLKKHPLITKIVLLFFIVVWFIPAYGQDSTYVDILDTLDENRVVWVNQIPALKEDVKKKRKGWLLKLILGEKDIPTLQKPVMALPMEVAQYVVLDQGNATLFSYENQKLTIPKKLRKQPYLFNSLVTACLFDKEYVLVTDSGNNAIYKVSKDFKEIQNLNDSLVLQRPTGIAYNNRTKQIWVVETATHRISVLDAQGHRKRVIGKRGTGEGEFNYPTSIWIDAKGKVYVVDALNYRIQRFDSEGNFEFMFGENGNGTGYFASPKGIATDSFGNIYVVDALFHGVQIFNKNGNYVYSFGTQGRQAGEFWMPSGIYIDAQNNIYVADSYNSRIQIFNLELKE